LRVHRKQSRVVRPLRLVPCLLLLLFALPATAQQEIVTVTDWRVHAGDNPAWASPDFDDSQWARIEYSRLDSFGLTTATHWYRAAFQVPAHFAGQELAVAMWPGRRHHRPHRRANLQS